MVLGISLNSRIMGLAVLRDQSLEDYKVKLFKERWCKEKAQKMLNCLLQCIEEYQINRLALMLPEPQYSTSEIASLISQVKARSKSWKLQVACFEPKSLYSLIEPVRAKKRALMQELSTRHPELGFLAQKELKNKKRYYSKLFEAVAAATLLASRH